MTLNSCSFQTDRTEVGAWPAHMSGMRAEKARGAFVASLLSETVTRELPTGWQGPYDPDRASAWFADRRDEGTVLPIVARSDHRPVGLLILTESEISDGQLDVFLGYLIHQRDWGRGLATEVVAGLADWCRANGTVRSIVAGVADGNAASARVLQKNGFVPASTVTHPSDGVKYTLTLAG